MISRILASIIFAAAVCCSESAVADDYWVDNPPYNEARHTGIDVDVSGRVLDGGVGVSGVTITVKLKKGSLLIDDETLQSNAQGEFQCSFPPPSGGFDCGSYSVELWIQGSRMPFYSESYMSGNNAILALPITLENSGC